MISFELATFQIILFIILVGLFSLMIKAGKKISSLKITHWLLFIYTGLLLLSSVFIAFVSDDSLKQQEVKQGETDHDFYSLLSSIEIDKLDPDYIIKAKSFDDYRNQTLEVNFTEKYSPHVIVERKLSSDNKIQVFNLSSGLFVDGIDFSSKLAPVGFILNENRLIINSPSQDINIKLVKAPFPVRQFTEESLFNQYDGRVYQVIYLKVPNDVELIEGSFVNFSFIER
ncbi:hypothetical protein V1503_23080 [Bacillus sp. SCS-151]|uniref:hypothetical protein n=1 Tax=Nanhaiella sioensis TaxID=3115293 RepID=UPI0039795BF3